MPRSRQELRRALATLGRVLTGKARGVPPAWRPEATPVYYINLDHRADRREHIVRELRRLGLPGTRIPAVHEPGREILGYARSHILTLERFLQSGATCGVVLEDDFTFHEDTRWVTEQLTRLFASGIRWDLVMLAGAILASTETEVAGLRKVSNAQTTSGYMVARHFAPVLLQNLRAGAALLEDHFRATGTKKHEWCLDQYWKRLQPATRWYIFYPKLGFQMDSYSDIEKRFVQYGGT